MPTIIQPQFDKIACRQKFLRPRKEDDIVIPDTAKTQPQALMPYGEVIAIGPDCKFTKIGDKVLVLAGNYYGFVDPNEPEVKEMCVLITSEQNVMGKYVESES